MGMPDKDFDLEKMMAELGLDEPDLADAGDINTADSIAAGKNDFTGASSVTEEIGFKSFDEFNETFHAAWMTSGKSGVKRMASVFSREARKKAMMMPIAASAVILTLIVAIGVTFALLNTLTGAVDNELKFGQTKVTVDETFDGWNAKEVKLTAASGNDYVPGVVRAMIVPYVLDGSGNYIFVDLEAMSAPVGNEMVLGDFTLELDTNWSANWFYKDGYFYFRKVLNPGDTTALLLTKVSLTNNTTAIREKYADADIKVEVMAGILQAEGGAPAAEWGVTVTDSTVTP